MSTQVYIVVGCGQTHPRSF